MKGVGARIRARNEIAQSPPMPNRLSRVLTSGPLLQFILLKVYLGVTQWSHS